MEDNRNRTKSKLQSNEEKILREVTYENTEESLCLPKTPLFLELEILQKKPNSHATQRVTVSVKPNIPTVKTLFLTEKVASKVKHATGDHIKSSNKRLLEDYSNETDSSCPNSQDRRSKGIFLDASSEGEVECSTSFYRWFHDCTCQTQTSNIENASGSLVKCYVQNQTIMNFPKINSQADMQIVQKIDKETLIVTKPSSKDSLNQSGSAIEQLNKRLEELERKVLRQQAIIYPIDLCPAHSSLIEESAEDNMKSTSMRGRAGCSYIDQYSHIPETSAFQRYAQKSSPLSLNRGSTGRTQNRQNSEQYGRDFTTYDGITSRARRQCASVPCKRNEIPTMHDRSKNIRHKLNPVHDYRLMDTVHYLAQGEFAPRDDGIKLTSSREAVLSDIIWEDVCRTHWPNARLSRRTTHYDRRSTRSELQRLIDGLLRERVSHVERKRRRHYKVVRLSHGQASCRAMGKTGDVIVASHKKPNERNAAGSECDATCRLAAEKQKENLSGRKCQRSYVKTSQEALPKRKFRPETEMETEPGTSHATRSPEEVRVWCRRHNGYHSEKEKESAVRYVQCSNEISSTSDASCRHHVKPRLVVKKDSRRMYHESPRTEHYILLPTLVVRSPSNLKRQRKFNELYHRVQHLRKNDSDIKDLEKKDVGMNINITRSKNEEGP